MFCWCDLLECRDHCHIITWEGRVPPEDKHVQRPYRSPELPSTSQNDAVCVFLDSGSLVCVSRGGA